MGRNTGLSGLRAAVLASAIVVGVSASATAAPISLGGPSPTFTHGVASGDVSATGAIVWTRIDREAVVSVEVSTDRSFDGSPVRAKVRALDKNDYTVWAPVRSLSPSTTYYYRFRAGDAVSEVGSFTTAPQDGASADVRLAYSGDSDGTRVDGAPFHGGFEVLDAVRNESPDFFAYLGDTIYSDSSVPGAPPPATTLGEYRAKYKENREIDALRNLLKATPIYAQWDDHEVLNDYDGQTVDPSRYANGRTAFLNYMPTARPLTYGGLSGKPVGDPSCASTPLFRKFHRGEAADVFIPDERSCRSADALPACMWPTGPDLAPTAPSFIRPAFGLPALPPPGCLEAINDPSRTMLGTQQKENLKQALLNSDAQFKLILNEVPIQSYYALPYDRWEGYAAERSELLNFIRANNIENVVFLTTDTHATIGNEVFVDAFTDPQPIAYEMIAGPIATFTLEEEIIATLGPEYVTQFHTVLSLIVGADCRNLDTFSYGSVEVDSDAGTATITAKDANGEALHDDISPAVTCTKTIGP